MTLAVKACSTSQLGHRTGICRGARGMTPMLFSTEIDMGSDLVGDTGIEPVTSSV
jgi:hypothetical protein